MDTAVLIAIINTVGLIVVAGFSLWGVIVSHRTEKAVDGLVTQRVDAETAIGVANASIARHEGGEAERLKGDERALAVLKENR